MNAPFLIPISKTADGDEETASLTAENKQTASHFNNYFENKKVKAAEEGHTRKTCTICLSHTAGFI